LKLYDSQALYPSKSPLGGDKSQFSIFNSQFFFVSLEVKCAKTKVQDRNRPQGTAEGSSGTTRNRHNPPENAAGFCEEISRLAKGEKAEFTEGK
jgi:hypothetical protein